MRVPKMNARLLPVDPAHPLANLFHHTLVLGPRKTKFQPLTRGSDNFIQDYIKLDTLVTKLYEHIEDFYFHVDLVGDHVHILFEKEEDVFVVCLEHGIAIRN